MKTPRRTFLQSILALLVGRKCVEAEVKPTAQVWSWMSVDEHGRCEFYEPIAAREANGVFTLRLDDYSFVCFNLDFYEVDEPTIIYRKKLPHA